MSVNYGEKEHSMSHTLYDTEFSPWSKPVGRIPLMARYQSFNGLKPTGPHRGLADSLLKNTTCKCLTCDGTGLHGTYGGMGWLACPTCHGMGETYCISLEELQALRQQVLDRYPAAAVPDWRPGDPVRCPFLRMEDGLILEACPQRRDDPVQFEIPMEPEVST